MMTIYEQVTNKDYSIEPILINQLIVLLKIVSGIDLLGQEASFKRNVIISGGFVTFEINFPYGVAAVTARNGVLTVDFKFLRKMTEQFPFNTWQCHIDVDHDMNFEQARFEYYLSISKYDLNRNDPSSTYCAFKINRVVDKEFNRFNTVEYNNLFSKSFRTYEDFFAIDLHTDFAVPNNEFEKSLIKFLEFFKGNPHSFYSIFPEYPSFVHVIEKMNKAKDFLNLFHKQYVNDFDLLTSRMLLIDMQEI